MIDGRASKVLGPDLAVQNRESGIHLTVLRCIFYRNFASWFTAGLGVWDVWPLAGSVSEVDFIHSDSMCLPNEGIFWDAQAGPELRTGVAELTLTDIHHDGGWTSAGIFSLAEYLSFVSEEGTPPDQQRLLYAGKMLDGRCTLSECNVPDKASLQFWSRILST